MRVQFSSNNDNNKMHNKYGACIKYRGS